MTRDGNAGAGLKTKQLRSLVARIDRQRQKIDDTRSEIGNLWAEAEDAGENRPALKMALKLRDMEADKRNDYLSSLARYCDVLEVWAQGDMFGDEPKIPQPPNGAAAAATPYEEGRAAAAAGAAASANPYAVEGAQNEAWRDGWTAQFAGARKRTPEPVQ
jgi:uncharacterized protein (UPF0335 family)